MSLQKSIPYIVCLCIGFSLVNVGTFGNLTLSSYFGFVFSSALLSLFVLFSIIFSKANTPIKLPLSLIFALLFVAYSYISGLTQNMVWLTHYYWIAILIFLVSLFYWLSAKQTNSELNIIFNGAVFYCFVESIVVLLQLVNLIPPKSNNFHVTGTWVNPNVTAMFLTMCLPCLLFLLFEEKSSAKRKYYLIVLILIFASLIFLKCRTAIIAGSIVTLYIYNWKYSLYFQIKNKTSQRQFFGLVALLVCCTIFIAVYAYRVKQGSTERRIEIWRTSIAMALKRPVIGYGYGRFEKYFNYEQPKEYAYKNVKVGANRDATYVYMAYNEFVQNFVEGGVVGLLLFLLLFFSVLYKYKRKFSKKTDTQPPTVSINETAIAGFLLFIFMSLINFTVQAVPAMIMMLIYMAILMKTSYNFVLSPKIMFFKKYFQGAVVILIILFSFSQIAIARSFMKNEQIRKNISDGSNNFTIDEMEYLRYTLKESGEYWLNYANALYLKKEYSEAIDKYKTAIKFQPHYQSYLVVGQLYSKIGKYDSAVAYGNLSDFYSMGRIKPKHFLMVLFAQLKDSINAIGKAKEIISTQPRIISDELLKYKSDARILIDNMNVR